MIWKEIVFVIAWLGWRLVHAASEENFVNEITSYLSSRRSRVNFGRMDLVVIQYQMFRVGSPDDDTWKMPVLGLNACLGVRSLGIVGWARSAIVTAGAVGQRNGAKMRRR